MATTDIPFIVGVIREKEKSLLEDDEYIRVIKSATNVTAAREALSDTAYGVHVANNMTSLEALDARLLEEFRWLVQMLGSEETAVTFIAARYDALHIAAALIDYKDGKEQPGVVVPIGTISAELLTSVIWHDTGWDDVPAAWGDFIKEQRAATQSDDWSRQAVTDATAAQMIVVMEENATSPLMRDIVLLTKERTETELEMRPDALPENLSAYEKQWDERTLAALRNHRLEPHTIDAVIAWWYALVIEGKTLRLLLTAAGGGVAPEQLEPLQRSLYLPWI